jgi:hypothetical protein
VCRVPFYTPRLVFGSTEGVWSLFHILCARTCFRRYRGRRVPFSCCVRSDLFSAVPSASGLVFLFFCSRTRFRRYLVRKVPFSCFARPDSFSAVSSASGLVFMFCALEIIFDGTEGVGSRFHVLCSRTRFRRYRGGRVPFSCFRSRTRFRSCQVCQVPFSCFARPDSFSTVPRASGPVFMYCAPGLIFGGTKGVWSLLHVFDLGLVFGGTEGVGSRFHVLRYKTRFWRYRVCRVPFSSFARSDSFSAVPRASSPVFMFCAPGLIFGGTGGVGSRFHFLRSRTRFRQYRGRRVTFSYIALPDSFLAVPSASGLFFMYCAPRLVFVGTEGVGSRFHILRTRTRFRRYRWCRVPFSCFALSDLFSTATRASGPVFMFCSSGLIFSGTEGVPSHFHVLHSMTCFRRYRGRRVPFSFFARLDSFLTVPRVSGPVFMFCAPGLVFGGTEGVRSLFHVFSLGLVFDRSEFVGSPFHVLRARIHSRRYRGRRVQFSCFALLDSFSTLPRASCPFFMFYTPGLVFRWN